MKIKYDTNLNLLAVRADKTPAQIEEEVLSFIERHDWLRGLEDKPKGVVLEKIIPGDFLVSQLSEALVEWGIGWVTERDFNALLNLEIIGSDNCPECGGKLYFRNYLFREIDGIHYGNRIGKVYVCHDCFNEVLVQDEF